MLIVWWIYIDFMMNVCWLYKESFMMDFIDFCCFIISVCWFYDEFMLILCWLYNDFMMSFLWWMYVDFMMILCWVYYECMSIVWWSYFECMVNVCWFHVEFMLIHIIYSFFAGNTLIRIFFTIVAHIVTVLAMLGHVWPYLAQNPCKRPYKLQNTQQVQII